MWYPLFSKSGTRFGAKCGSHSDRIGGPFRRPVGHQQSRPGRELFGDPVEKSDGSNFRNQEIPKLVTRNSENVEPEIAEQWVPTFGKSGNRICPKAGTGNREIVEPVSARFVEPGMDQNWVPKSNQIGEPGPERASTHAPVQLRLARSSCPLQTTRALQLLKAKRTFVVHIFP